MSRSVGRSLVRSYRACLAAAAVAAAARRPADSLGDVRSSSSILLTAGPKDGRTNGRTMVSL